MGSAYEDTVLDFDLNFLQQSPNIVNDCRLERQKKAILIAKKKTVATDSLIKKYFAKKEQLEQTEIVLLTAKEECKQVCIDYKESLEKCTQLEKDVQSLQNLNKELQLNCEMAQNQVEAIRSHSHQLQVLVKEHETVIEALKIENQLEKNNVKDYEKNLLNLQKENETLLNDLCLVRDIVLGKKKLNKHHKLILQKYDKARRKCNVDDSASESSSDETELFDSSPSSPLFSPFGVTTDDKNKERDLKPNENVTCTKKESTRVNKDYDSDCSTERVSEDTGRGSSLAFSDGEKCFNSPDYFNNDSPFTTECNKIKEQRIFVDACTSPRTISEVVHIATSPILFDDEALLSGNNTITPIEKDPNGAEYFITDIPLSSEIVTIKEKKSVVNIGTSTDIKMSNVATSPILFQELDLVHKKLTHSATSPIQNIQNCGNIITEPDVSLLLSPDKAVNNVIAESVPSVEVRHTIIQNLSSQCELEISDKSLEEKRCLEKNNSNNICSENTNDSEIEMILNSMRLTEKLITPIPKTPIKISKEEGKKLMSPVREQLNLPNKHIICPESLKLREENRVLQTSISDLSKEIINIKCILKKQHLMPETPKKHLSKVDKCQIINSELFDDSSHEVISIHLDGEKNSDENNKGYDEITNDDLTNISKNMDISISPPTVENNVNHGPVIQSIEVFPAGSQVRNEISLPTELILHKSSERKNEKSFDSVSLVDSRNSIENNLRMENEVEETLACDSNEEILVNDSKYKNIKHKKLSRLERFRKKLLPKSKIKRINVPIRKLHTKSKVIPVTNSKTMEAELLVNNKSAYEKAIRVMKELKQKKGNDETKGAMNKKIKNIGNDKINSEQKEFNNNRNDSICDSIERYTSINKSPVQIKQPVICLSPIRLSSPKDKDKQQKTKVTSPRRTEDIILSADSSPTKNFINTRSRTKSIQDSITSTQVNSGTCKYNESQLEESKEFTKECTKPVESKKRLKRAASDNPPVECKRILRSQNVKEMFNEQANAEEVHLSTNSNILYSSNSSPQKKRLSNERNENWNILTKDISKSLNFTDSINTNIKQNIDVKQPINHPKESILCKMLEKHGKEKIKYSAKKIPDDVSNTICKKLEDDIAKIIELPIDKTKSAMTKLVDEIKHSWKMKKFMSGFMKYLKDPARKRELFNKVTSPPAPPMTKSEQVLLFVMRQLEISSPNTVSMILTYIEFSLFQLNKSPEFDVIESMAHFYALLCRYFGFKNRLRQFLLDAMYCLQFKVVPLIKQCLDVWMHILPLAHMGIAKSPLVTCLVYLLHFYKCEDKFNRIQDIRFILNKKYFYQVTDWNETKILEMFRNSIMELRDIKVEKKMLRMAFIILAKRQGPKWCQKNIVKNMLLPMIEKEDIPMRIRQFSVELLGPLLKPYPGDMKVHCEIVVNQLLDMLEQEIPDSMKESIFTSLIYMNKHNQNRVTQSLLSWSPKRVSPEFEGLMRDFVREKPLKVWKGILSRTAL